MALSVLSGRLVGTSSMSVWGNRWERLIQRDGVVRVGGGYEDFPEFVERITMKDRAELRVPPSL
jgi:hypothetical protein